MEGDEKMKKIKPCCLCGSDTLKLWRAVIGDGKHHVECDICHNCGPHKRTVRGAVRAWNKMRRPTKLLIGKAEETQ